MRYWHKDRQYRPLKWNREPRNEPHIWPDDFLASTPKLFNGEEILFKKRSRKNCLPTCKMMMLDSCCTPQMLKKINQKPNIRTDSLKLLKENKSGKLHNTGFDNHFLSSVISTSAKRKIDKFVCIKTKKESVSKTLRTLTTKHKRALIVGKFF